MAQGSQTNSQCNVSTLKLLPLLLHAPSLALSLMLHLTSLCSIGWQKCMILPSLSFDCSFWVPCDLPELGVYGGQHSERCPPSPWPLVYTHLLPVVQSTINLGGAAQGFCRCNEVPKLVDLKKERLPWWAWSNQMSLKVGARFSWKVVKHEKTSLGGCPADTLMSVLGYPEQKNPALPDFWPMEQWANECFLLSF